MVEALRRVPLGFAEEALLDDDRLSLGLEIEKGPFTSGTPWEAGTVADVPRLAEGVDDTGSANASPRPLRSRDGVAGEKHADARGEQAMADLAVLVSASSLTDGLRLHAGDSSLTCVTTSNLLRLLLSGSTGPRCDGIFLPAIALIYRSEAGSSKPFLPAE